MTTAWTTACHV